MSVRQMTTFELPHLKKSPSTDVLFVRAYAVWGCKLYVGVSCWIAMIVGRPRGPLHDCADIRLQKTFTTLSYFYAYKFGKPAACRLCYKFGTQAPNRQRPT